MSNIDKAERNRRYREGDYVPRTGPSRFISGRYTGRLVAAHNG